MMHSGFFKTRDARRASWGTSVTIFHPMKTLTVSLALTMALFMVLSWLIWNSYTNFKTTQTKDFRLQDLSGIIIHLDEALTMSTHMAAATGNLWWEERYRFFEPQLDAAIKEAMQSMPEAFMSEAAARTNAANVKLVALENRAFDLVRKGDRKAASSLLSSAEYAKQKQTYNQGINEISSALKRRVQTSLAAQRRKGFIAVGAVGIAILILAFIWFSSVRIVQRYIAERNRAEMILQKEHEILEGRVRERTVELSKVNEELQVEIANHKHVEEELRQSESKYRTLIENLPQKIFYKDLNSVYEYCNNNYAMDLRINADEIIGKTDYDFYPRDLAEQYRAEDKQILASGEIKDIEEKYLKDDKEVIIQKVKTPIKDAKGNPAGILGIFWDITPRKIAEMEKTRFENMLKDKIIELFIMNEISEVLLSTRELNKILHMILLGATSYQALGFNRAFLFLMSEEKNELQGTLATGALSVKEAYQTWERLTRDSHTLKELLKSHHGELSREDEPINNLVKRITIPLHETESIFSQAVYEKRSFNIVHGAHNQLVDQGVIRLLETDAFALVPLVSRDKTLGVILADNFINRKPIVDEDVARLRAFANHASLAIENSRLYESLKVKVEELSRAYHELQVNRDKLFRYERLSAVGEMATIVSHEIRTPLVAIGGFARRILKKSHNGQLNKKYLAIIIAETDRLEKTLSDILDFAKPTVPNIDAVDINRIIKSTIEILSLEIEQHTIIVEKKLEPKLPLLWLDENQIRRVFINLIKNAIDAMPHGGTMTVTTVLENQWVRIETTDTGMGIADDDIDKLFDAFFTSKSTGFGLGLTVSSQIIANHGGSIEVRTRKPKGTSFTVKLPVKELPEKYAIHEHS